MYKILGRRLGLVNLSAVSTAAQMIRYPVTLRMDRARSEQERRGFEHPAVVFVELLARVQGNHTNYLVAIEDRGRQCKTQRYGQDAGHRSQVEGGVGVEDDLPMGERPAGDSLTHGNSG